MDTVHTIAKNAGVLLLAEIICKGLGIFYVMYMARFLGAEGFGILSFALAFTGIFGVFTDMGLGAVTVREVARNKSLAPKYLGNIAVIKLFLVPFTLGLISLSINLLGYPEDTIKVVYIFSFYMVFVAFTVLLNSIIQAFEKMEYISSGRILTNSFMLVGVLMAIKFNFSVVGFAYIYFFAGLIGLVYSIVVSTWKFVLPVIEVDWSFWRSITKKALPFGMSGVFVMIYFYIDSVMLSLIEGNEVVGWYNAAYKIVLLFTVIPGVVISAIYPVTSRLYAVSTDSLKYTYGKIFNYMLIVGIPLGVGITLLSGKLILLFYGHEYLPSVIALQILIWTNVFMFTNFNILNLLNSIDKQIIVTRVTMTGAFINIILNFMLIPKYSYSGASIATVATEFLMFLIVFNWVSRSDYRLPKMDTLFIILKIMIACSAMGVFIIYFSTLSLTVSIPVSILLYFVILYYVKGFNEDDKKIFFTILNTKREGME